MKYKKRGFSFLQTLIVFMLIILIINISINLISYNYLKSNAFKSYSDKKSLTAEEELTLKEINKLNQKEGNYHNYGNYELKKIKEVYYLINNKSSTKAYLQLELKERNGQKVLVPTYYKTGDILGG